MKKQFTQADLDKALDKLMSGDIGNKSEGQWDFINKKTKFTKSQVIEVASKYEYLQDFKTQSNGEYQYAERFGFLNELNLKRQYKVNRDLESIRKIAKQYNSRWEFQQNEMSIYHKAQNEGWLEEVCLHMIPQKVTYTFEMCKEIGSKYSGRTDWYNNHQNSYQVALRRGWVNKIFPKTKKCGRAKQTFTKSQVTELAKKYNNRSDFRRNNQAACRFAKNQGWLNDILNKVFPK